MIIDATADVESIVQGEETSTAEPTPEPAAPPSNGSERLFTQADVDRVVAKRLQRERETRQAAPPKQQGSTNESELLARIAELETANQFATATADLSLKPAQRAALQALFKVEAPADPTQWAHTKATELGWGVQNQQPARPQPAPELTLPTGTSQSVQSDGGSPAPVTPTYTSGDDPRLWDRATINQIYNDKGVREGRRFMRQRWDQFMTQLQVLPPNKKG